MTKLRELILQLAVRGELTQDWRTIKNLRKEESWKTVGFFDFCILQRGYDLPLANRDEGSFPIVTSAGVAAYHSEYKAKAPGVIVGRSGSIGKVFYVNEDFWPHNTALYVKDFKGNFPRYVYFYLLSFKAEQFSKSTAVPTLNRNNLRGIVVDVPSYEEQQQIVIKIEELMRLCDELETKLRQGEADSEKLMNAAVQHVLKSVTEASTQFAVSTSANL
jgi:type I restriction enzyme S subunit